MGKDLAGSWGQETGGGVTSGSWRRLLLVHRGGAQAGQRWEECRSGGVCSAPMFHADAASTENRA